MDAYAIANGLVLYFQATNVSAASGLARAARADVGSDFGPIEGVEVDASQGAVWVATRGHTPKPFSGAHLADGLPAGAYPNWLSADECRLYFTAQDRIYVASKQP